MAAGEADVTTELAQLAEALNAPVITTPEGKGAIPENHPLSVGTFYYGHGAAYYTLPQADVILAIGSRMNMNPRTPWSLRPDQVVIRIDADPEELVRNVESRVGMVADARLAVNYILAEWGGAAGASQWDGDRAGRDQAQGLRRYTGPGAVAGRAD